MRSLPRKRRKAIPDRRFQKMSDQTHIALNDGARIPQVGLGVWQTPNDEAAPAVKARLALAYARPRIV